jgi:cyclopropane-fatty-acyl-phospholipid synthase
MSGTFGKIDSLAVGGRTPSPAFLQRLARRAVLARLRMLRRGEVALVEGNEREVLGLRSPDCDFRATITINDARFYSALAFGGSIGAAEAYMDGFWTCDDLVTLFRIITRNQDLFFGVDHGLARLTIPLQRLFHFFRRNTRSGARRNISAHYDLGNEFFALFLDETMMYSCATFDRDDMTLAEASRAKLDGVCRKLDLSPRDHLLEIGTGWGGLAIHAAANFGCRVTTTTISTTQRAMALARIGAAGLADRVTVLLEDYRSLCGKFDKLVSVEMIEAVGHQFFDAYFKSCSDLLKPEGMMLLQAITIPDNQFESAKTRVDFIKRYIFPGSCIPSVAAICASLARVTDLRLFHLEDITPHYARTLHEWRRGLLANLDRVRALGYSEEFIRMWEFYLCYCEGGFIERYIGDVQMLLTKPQSRRAPIRPALAG